MSLLSRLFTRTPRRETTRAEMDEAIKRLVVPQLREQGWKGTMPHLRRLDGDYYQLLSFQFSKWGGSFCVDAARCRTAGLTGPLGHIPGDKAKAHNMPRRYRVGPKRVVSDHWYKFEKADPDAIGRHLLAERRQSVQRHKVA